MSGVAQSASFEAKLCFVRKTTHDGDWRRGAATGLANLTKAPKGVLFSLTAPHVELGPSRIRFPNNLTLRSRQNRKQSFIILTYKKVNAVSSFAERYFVDKSF